MVYSISVSSWYVWTVHYFIPFQHSCIRIYIVTDILSVIHFNGCNYKETSRVCFFKFKIKASASSCKFPLILHGYYLEHIMLPFPVNSGRPLPTQQREIFCWHKFLFLECLHYNRNDQLTRNTIF